MKGLLGLSGLSAMAGGSAPTTFADDFNDGVFDTTKWTRDDSTQVKEQNGRIEILSSVHLLISNLALNMSGGRYIAFKTNPNGGKSWCRFFLNGGADYYEARFSQDANQSWFGTHTGGGGDSWSLQTNYDAVNDAYLRFKHDPATGNIQMHTSPDGATWTLRASVPRPNNSGITACQLQVLNVGATTVHVDNVTSDVPIA